MVTITDELAKNVAKAWAPAGERWVRGLPGLVAEIEERWSIRAREPFDATFHYVAPAVRENGTEVVLKFGVGPLHKLARRAVR